MLHRQLHASTPGKGIARLSGRTQEIQRLIGQKLTSGFRYAGTGERTVIVDVDVQADAGTRTTAVPAVVGPERCYRKLVRQGALERSPIRHQVAAGFGGSPYRHFWI